MTGTPSFSVVVPTRRRPAYLASCLEALAALDYDPDDYEVVIAVDGEPDPQTARLLTSYTGHIALRSIIQRPSGPSTARNAGAAAARGRFLAFTDDDCRPDPGWLRALAGALARAPGAAVGGRTVNGVAELRCSIASQTLLDVTHAHNNRPGRPARFFASNNLAIPADAFRALGGFDAGMRYAEDRELCRRWVSGGGALVAAPDAVVVHVRELRLASFLRQQFGYGRGAFAYHRASAEAPHLVPALEPGFYGELVQACRRGRDGIGRGALASLLAAGQAANAAGFATALIRNRVRRGSVA